MTFGFPEYSLLIVHSLLFLISLNNRLFFFSPPNRQQGNPRRSFYLSITYVREDIHRTCLLLVFTPSPLLYHSYTYVYTFAPIGRNSRSHTVEFYLSVMHLSRIGGEITIIHLPRA